MAIEESVGRQYTLVAGPVDVLFSDVVSGVASDIGNIPGKAIITGGFINVVTAFDSATTDVVDIGRTDDPNAYTATPVDLQTTGVTALDVTGEEITGKQDFGVTWTGVGTAPTQGEFYVVIEYIIRDRGNEVQPNT